MGSILVSNLALEPVDNTWAAVVVAEGDKLVAVVDRTGGGGRHGQN